MITPDHARLFARYNRWQNKSLYESAGTLTEAQRKEQRGAFFGSIHATLNHLLWADQIWMSRLASLPPPAAASIKESLAQYGGWPELEAARARFDEVIRNWSDGLRSEDLEGDLTWFSGAAGRELTRPRWQLVVHLFNHQTHHRGQVHCLLTQFGAKPEATDIAFMPE